MAKQRERFISKEALLDRVGLSYSHVRRLTQGGQFPEPICLTAWKRVWRESEIAEWIAERVAERETLAVLNKRTPPGAGRRIGRPLKAPPAPVESAPAQRPRRGKALAVETGDTAE
jgi:predicted DNA-binding transcriptional regulator AlpA